MLILSIPLDSQPWKYQKMFTMLKMVIGNHRIVLNDSDSGLPLGMNVSLLASMDSVEAVKAAYNKLKEGARIISPISETTYSSCFVSLVDRFDVRWELIKENEGEN
jgi:PhnB protein